MDTIEISTFTNSITVRPNNKIQLHATGDDSEAYYTFTILDFEKIDTQELKSTYEVTMVSHQSGKKVTLFEEEFEEYNRVTLLG